MKEMIYQNKGLIDEKIPKGHVRVAGTIWCDSKGDMWMKICGLSDNWGMAKIPFGKNRKALIDWSAADDDGIRAIDLPFWFAENYYGKAHAFMNKITMIDKYGTLYSPKGEKVATKKEQQTASDYWPF